jgi:hypothetical protein
MFVLGRFYGAVSATSGGVVIRTTALIDITPSVAYRLSFWGRGNCDLICGAISADGESILSRGNPGDITDDNVWVQREFEFTVSEPAIRLAFNCIRGDIPQTLRLDAVSLVPTIDGCPLTVGP